jgi:Protein of unknown function (DUF565)
MQNTRLTTLVNTLSVQLQEQLRNPWRRLATLGISLLFGIYLGTAFSSVAGQLAQLDILACGAVAIAVELISWLFYSSRFNLRKSLLGEALNALKFGVIYGLFLIAFLLGS